MKLLGFDVIPSISDLKYIDGFCQKISPLFSKIDFIAGKDQNYYSA